MGQKSKSDAGLLLKDLPRAMHSSLVAKVNGSKPCNFDD
jgi:hypothetical protein